MPAVTVAMSMHDASRFLRECIDSVLSQTFADFEFLIVDDGSTDGSADIVRSYSDPRIRLVCRSHDFIASLNTLLDCARGRYIARMDADDIMLPDRLQIEYDYLEAHPEVAAVCSHAVRIDSNGSPIGQIGSSTEVVRITPRMMCETNHVCNPTTMMRRDIIDKYKMRYESEYEFAEDYRFWSRVVSECGPIDCLPQQLLHYRVSDGQVTATHWDEMMEATERVKSSLISTLVDKANPGYTDPEIEDSNLDLTLIIPFLNEGEEVENTVRSFLAHGGKGRVDILVINDCSYDSYPYMERLMAIPGVTYILNRERLGVAASRDKGVNLCRTPYFLLLDAHMRAYDDLWLAEIPRLLRENDRRILCCQNKALEKDIQGNILTDNDLPTYFGARMIISRRPPIPGIDWIDNELMPSANVETIPLVLGAGYATSRTYWRRIGGLKGLRQYGCDEQLMSLKTWLEGGSCLLLKRVILGHIYRKRMPYDVDWHVPIYNNLLVTETLFPLRERIMARAAAYVTDRKRFMDAFSEIRDYLASNNHLRRSGAEHRRRFDSFMRINSRPKSAELSIREEVKRKIDEVYATVSDDIPTETGLFEGIIGRALWLMCYAASKGDDRISSTAAELIVRLTASLPLDDYSFSTGLSGIGWALIYMARHRFIESQENILILIDRSLAGIIANITDNSFADGKAGILAYTCARVTCGYNVEFITNNQSSFDRMAKEILADTTDSVAAYYAMLWLQIHVLDFSEIPEPYLTDWMTPSNFIPRNRRFWSMSLQDGVLATSLNSIINSIK